MLANTLSTADWIFQANGFGSLLHVMKDVSRWELAAAVSYRGPGPSISLSFSFTVVQTVLANFEL
jgi:hypothetical protein